MELRYSRLVSCIIVALFPFSFFASAQIIWSEDFESYVDDTGYKGSTSESSGDYPSGVSKWTLDVSNSTLTSESQWFMVNQVSSNNIFETCNVTGEAVWESERINISNYVDVVIEASISEVGSHESNDYLKLYYKLDDGSEILFSVNGENFGDFGNLTAIQPGLSGDSLRIKIRALNTANSEKIRFDDVKVKGVSGTASLIFTEVIDPSDGSGARYVEFKNLSSSSIDFDQLTYYLSRQNEGDENNWGDLKLTGTLPSGGLRIVGNNSSDFNTSYGYTPTYINTIIDGDGRDAYVIFSGGDHTAGVVVDICGKIDEDGDGQDWDYIDKRAVRQSNVNVGVNEWSSSEWTISSANVSDATPGALENEFRYGGSVWRPDATAPTTESDSKDVVVQSGTATISSSFDCASLKVYSGSTLELGAGNGITVNGAVTNNGTLKLKSDATSNSSLITTGSSTGNLQYDLYVTGGASSPWHLISSPVESQSINDFVTDASNSIQTSANDNYGVAIYNTTTEAWNYYHNGSGVSPNVAASGAGNFLSAKGYSILRSSSGEISFSGTINTENQSIALTANKWNLIGNPYPSFINVNTGTNILTECSSVLDASYQAIYTWNPSSTTYDIINNASSTTYLSPGQGFFVRAASGGGNCSFTEAMQSHQTGDWFQRGASDWVSVKLVAEFESIKSSTEVKYIDDTSYGLDLGFDAGRFNGANNDYYVFTKLVDGSQDFLELGLQCIPPFDEFFNEPIPIGVFVSEDVEVNFSVELTDFNDDVLVYIEDVLQDTYTRLDLDDSFYSTWVGANEASTGRFYLHTQSSSVVLEDLNASDYTVFLSDNSKILNIIGAIDFDAQATLYDCLGRLVYSSRLDLANRNELLLPDLNSGIYVLSFTIKNGIIQKKILIQ